MRTPTESSWTWKIRPGPSGAAVVEITAHRKKEDLVQIYLVEPLPRGVWQVAVIETGEVYQLQPFGLTYRCDCRAFQFCRAPKTCKHVRTLCEVLKGIKGG